MTADICKLSVEWERGSGAAGMGVESQLQMGGGSRKAARLGKVWRGQRAGAWQMPTLQILASSQPGSAQLQPPRPASPRLLRQVISTRNGMPAKFSSILASLALIYD